MPTNKEIMEFKKVTQPYIDAYNRIKEREYKRRNNKDKIEWLSKQMNEIKRIT